jgi:hypothetical protein
MKKTTWFLYLLFLCFNFCFCQDFDEKKVKILFEKFNEQSVTPFNYKTLNTFLKDVKIEELKSGKEIEKEVLFEDFICECKDKLKISYHKESNVFLLYIYEESYTEDLDWCPEHTYQGVFNIENDKVVQVTFKLVAG